MFGTSIPGLAHANNGDDRDEGPISGSLFFLESKSMTVSNALGPNVSRNYKAKELLPSRKILREWKNSKTRYIPINKEIL